MRRFTIGCLVFLMLWALAPGMSEAVENVLHLIVEGHTAHAEADGDSHDPLGPEHGCTGVTHLCSCCISQTFLTNQAVLQVPGQTFYRLAGRVRVQFLNATTNGIDHPPRV
jgi:hypothetical protein